MGKQLKYLGLFVSLLIIIAFAVFVVNQTAQFVGLATSVNPTLGQVALFALLAIYAALVLIPIVLFIRLPKAMRPPARRDSPEFAAYITQLAARLRRNPNLTNCFVPGEDPVAVEAALKVLDSRANEIVKATASAVFVSTAISQSGRLDALMVLAAQSRMVWQVAHVYNQRPSLGELTRLYANVAASAFASAQMEDLDVGEQVETVLAPIIGSSLVSVIPGVNAVAILLVNAIVEGSANAFMTLRVGAITKQYCASLTTVERPMVRRFATAEAAGMLGAVLLESGGVVSKAIIGAAAKAGRGVLSRPGQATRDALSNVSDTLSQAAERTSKGVCEPITEAARDALRKVMRKSPAQ